MRALYAVSTLLLSVAILLTGNGLLGVLVPVRARLEGFSAFDLGLLGSAYFFGFGIGCLRGARLVQLVGHIRTYTAMTATAASAVVVLGLFPSAPVWWCLRAVLGFCFAVLFMVIESWLNEQATQETRGLVLSVYMVLNLTVVTLGQMLLPLHDPRLLELFAIAALLISLAAVPVAVTRASAPQPIESARVRIGRLWTVSPTGFSTCLAVGLANGAFWAMAPVFAQAEGLDEKGIALFMSAAVLGGAAGTWPLGRLSDRLDRRKVIVLTGLFAAGAAALIVLRLYEGATSRTLLAGLWGAASFSLYGLAVAHANDCAEPGDFVETSSGLLLLYAVGAVVGPLAASSVMGSFGPKAFFVFPAGVHGVLVLYVAWRMARREDPVAGERGDFVDALCAARTVSQVFEAEIQARLEGESSSRREEDPGRAP